MKLARVFIIGCMAALVVIAPWRGLEKAAGADARQAAGK
jgi:hypothetical protein